MSVKTALSSLQSYPAELGLDLTRPEGRFRWFLASILFAKRISAETAKKTYRRFEEEGLTTPEMILEVGWDCLVEVLDSGGYARYDFSTATNLLETMKALREKYGDLDRLHREAKDSADLERRLQEFKGIGPTGTNIFLRELRTVWEKAKPNPCKMAVDVGQKLDFKDVEPYESSLVRLNLEYCKKMRCRECPVRNHCKEVQRKIR